MPRKLLALLLLKSLWHHTGGPGWSHSVRLGVRLALLQQSSSNTYVLVYPSLVLVEAELAGKSALAPDVAVVRNDLLCNREHSCGTAGA